MNVICKFCNKYTCFNNYGIGICECRKTTLSYCNNHSIKQFNGKYVEAMYLDNSFTKYLYAVYDINCVNEYIVVFYNNLMLQFKPTIDFKKLTLLEVEKLIDKYLKSQILK